MAQSKENIVLFPFMAQGHILPFLALAHQLEQRNNYNIIFINTPLNTKKIKSSLLPNSSIRLLEIPFDSSKHGLPPNSENTDTLPFSLMVQLLQTSHSFKPAFQKLFFNLVQELGHPPLCLIVDLFFSWTAEIAHEFGVFHAIFNAGGGYGMACYHSLWSNLPSMNTPFDEFSLPGFPRGSLIRTNQIPENIRVSKITDPWTVFHHKMFNEWLDSDAFLFNTVEMFDHVGLNYFRRQVNLPVWPIGPVLLSTKTESRGGRESGIKWELIKKWLDTKPSSSVLYISFGSQSTILASQMMQLALSLDASGKNFIWVVRPPKEFDINSEFRANEWLPNDFKERIRSKNQGLLVHSWSPQLKILSHKATSAFLSHCGWNSVIESLSNGVPLLAWPIMAEQHFNAKMLEEEAGVCVQVAEGLCEVKHEEILEKIELVMNETDKGKDMRRKASEVKEDINNAIRDEEGLKGSSVKALDEFLHAAVVSRRVRQGI
ncbi:unnamed protein product [Dovyalis caffra]|uniref:Glycosyltransferase n=1 Tax=Dovyalis caffra TaxID=77055 RepID=A0AAV1RRG2_9ROSI|nr:unnamed protein product [Dovyalis caffra]